MIRTRSAERIRATEREWPHGWKGSGRAHSVVFSR
jgi:hypothetical protein